MPKTVLGIEIIFDYTSAASFGESNVDINFYVKNGVPHTTPVEHGKSEVIFVSSPTIRDSIMHHPLFGIQAQHSNTGRHLGAIRCRLLSNQKHPSSGMPDTLKFTDYNPLSYRLSDIPNTIFEKKGIASILEFMALKRLKVKFPTLRFIEHALKPEPSRVRQLVRRGLKLEEIKGTYSLSKGIKLLEAKIKRSNHPRLP